MDSNKQGHPTGRFDEETFATGWERTGFWGSGVWDV